MKPIAIGTFGIFFTVFAALGSGDVYELDGAIREKDGGFVLSTAYGPGMWHESQAVGQKEILAAAAELTDAVRKNDADTGLVGRFNPLTLEVRELSDGVFEILSARAQGGEPLEQWRRGAMREGWYRTTLDDPKTHKNFSFTSFVRRKPDA